MSARYAAPGPVSGIPGCPRCTRRAVDCGESGSSKLLLLCVMGLESSPGKHVFRVSLFVVVLFLVQMSLYAIFIYCLRKSFGDPPHVKAPPYPPALSRACGAAVEYYIILYYTILLYIMLYHITLHFVRLYYVIFYYIILYNRWEHV